MGFRAREAQSGTGLFGFRTRRAPDKRWGEYSAERPVGARGPFGRGLLKGCHKAAT
ncbi:hypothetical protein GCM10010256_57180 [Streptomyces coeruleorubidus]|nr:hypothetical protein GCM10010256_57180 [Streptomyces coeruleorubidus]